MVQRNRKLPITQMLIAVASALVGIMVGPLLENIISPLFSTSTTIELSFAAATSLIVVIALIVYSILFNTTRGSLDEILVTANDLKLRAGVSVRLLTYGEDKECSSSFSLAMKLVKEASQEILVLDYLPWVGEADALHIHGSDGSERRQYYDILDTVLDRPELTYRRIIQIPEGPKPEINESLIDDDIDSGHLRKMVSVNLTRSHSKSRLMCSSVCMPNICFMIIDRRYVVWEVPFVDIARKLAFEADIFIDDPHGELIRDLLDLYSRIEDSSTLVQRIGDMDAQPTAIKAFATA